MVCFSKDVKVPVKVRRTLSSVGTSSSNTLGSCYDQLSISAIPYFWLCLFFWQDLQDLSYDQMVLCIPLQSIMDLLVSLRRGWLGLGNGDTN